MNTPNDGEPTGPTVPEVWLEMSNETRDNMSLAWWLASVFPGNNFTVTMEPLHVFSHCSGLDPVQIRQEVRNWFKIFRGEDVLQGEIQDADHYDYFVKR
jgi:hypothetical protein